MRREVEDPVELPVELRGSPEPGADERLSPRVWLLGALMLLLGAVTSVLLFRGFHSDSYLYLAFYCIPANTAITIFPHEPVLLYFGKFADLWLTALAATAGTVVAACLDYAVFVPLLDHRSVRAYKEKLLYRKAIGYFGRAPFPTLVAAALAPVPFFPFKFLTFSMGYPLGRYLAALVTGRFPRYYLLAWLGAALRIPNWVLVGVFLMVIAIYAAKAGPRALARIGARRRRAAQPAGPQE